MVLHGLDVLEDVVRASFCCRRFFRSTTFAGRSWCPEVGLRFLDFTFCDRYEVESRIPKPTSGHLDRVTCWCPEVGLGVPNFTCGIWCPVFVLVLYFNLLVCASLGHSVVFPLL